VIAPVSVFGATPAAPVPQARAAKPTLALPASKEAPPPPLPEQAPQTPPPAPSAAAISGQGLIAAKVERTPQAWIEDIRRLMKEGKSEEAGGQLAEFKKRYPDYVLPEELR
jgi:hypothetical protein